jgi:hypothetical protein
LHRFFKYVRDFVFSVCFFNRATAQNVIWQQSKNDSSGCS